MPGLAERTERLLHEGDALPVLVDSYRLSLEISVIQTLAFRLTGFLAERDPLSERVHLGGLGVAGTSLLAVINGTARRFRRRARPPVPAAHT